jgi:very-short-patch-repair endonuclease
MMASISEERRAFLREIGKRGGQARAKQLTPEHQRKARSHVKRESLVQAGKRGYAKCCAKFGEDFAARRVAAYRRDHPTCLERIVMVWLDEMGVGYAIEEPIDDVFVDFLAFGTHVIECNGETWHTCAAPHFEDRPARDQRKHTKLERLGYHVLWLSERAILDGSGRKLLADFLTEGR